MIRKRKRSGGTPQEREKHITRFETTVGWGGGSKMGTRKQWVRSETSTSDGRENGVPSLPDAPKPHFPTRLTLTVPKLRHLLRKRQTLNRRTRQPPKSSSSRRWQSIERVRRQRHHSRHRRWLPTNPRQFHLLSRTGHRRGRDPHDDLFDALSSRPRVS